MTANSKRGVSSIPNNLPRSSHLFIDRDREIQRAIGALLGSKALAVVLVGIAGIGKTALALEIAHRLLDRGEFADGIVWLPARHLQSWDDLSTTLAQVLGIPDSKVASWLNSKHCLVVLDGFDELSPQLEATATRFLDAFPAPSKVLVTSRKHVEVSTPTVLIQVDTLDEDAAIELFSRSRQWYGESSDVEHQAAAEIVRALGNHTLALILAARLVRGDYAEARKSFGQIFDTLSALRDDRVRAALLHTLASAAQAQGDYSQALQLYQQSLVIEEQLDDSQAKSATLNNLAQIYFARGEHDRASALYQESLSIKERLGDLQGKSVTLNNLAQIYFARGEYDRALALYQESLAILEETGDIHGKATTLNNLAQISFSRGDLDRALTLYQESLAILEEIGDRAGVATTLNNLAQVYFKRDDLNNALALNQQSLAILREIGDLRGTSTVLLNLGQYYTTLDDLERALPFYRESLVLAEKVGLANQVDRAGTALANVALTLGKGYIEQDRWYDALRLFEESLAIYRQGDDLDARADTIYQIARTHHLIGNLDKARTHYRDALRLFEHIQNEYGIAVCKTGLGRLMIQMGFLDDAIRELKSAKQTYKQLGKDKRVEEIEEMLQIANRVKEHSDHE